jgi:hypothetical protein
MSIEDVLVELPGYTITYTDEFSLRCTGGSEFLTKDGATVKAMDLKVGMEMRGGTISSIVREGTVETFQRVETNETERPSPEDTGLPGVGTKDV